MNEDCLILSDGTKGMENQSIAIAKQLKLKFKILNFKPNIILKTFPILANYFYFALKNNIHFVEKYNFRYVISTGKRMVPYSILMKKKFGKKIINIHLQKPTVSCSFFDILILPEHDNVKGKNIFKTEGALSFYNYKDINDSYKINKKKLKNFKRPNVLLLLGGDNKRYNVSYGEYCKFLLKVKYAVEKISGNLIVSTSRRTPNKVTKIINIVFNKFKNKFFLLNDKENNFYPGMLKITDFVIVTSDSVNMISEIATINIPLFIGFLKEEEKGKLSHFNKTFLDNSYAYKFDQRLFIYNKKTLVKNNFVGKKISRYLNQIKVI